MATVNVTLSFDDSALPAIRQYAPLALNYDGANTNAAKDAFLKQKLADQLKAWVVLGAIKDATETASASAQAQVASITIT